MQNLPRNDVSKSICQLFPSALLGIGIYKKEDLTWPYSELLLWIIYFAVILSSLVFLFFFKTNTKHLVGKTRNNNNDTIGNITRYWRLIFPVDDKQSVLFFKRYFSLHISIPLLKVLLQSYKHSIRWWC